MNGIGEKQRRSILTKFAGDKAERNVSGNAKRRNDIDLEEVIPTVDGSDLRVVDLLNPSL